MKKTAVIYWSGTGNTEAMAGAVLAGMKDGGADAVMLTPDQVDAASVGKYDAIAFGCPAMGSEMLEESEFEPMFSSVKGSLGGKKIALFGSYGWGDGDWMRIWEADCGDAGITSPARASSAMRHPTTARLRPARPWASGSLSNKMNAVKMLLGKLSAIALALAVIALIAMPQWIKV